MSSNDFEKEFNDLTVQMNEKISSAITSLNEAVELADQLHIDLMNSKWEALQEVVERFIDFNDIVELRNSWTCSTW